MGLQYLCQLTGQRQGLSHALNLLILKSDSTQYVETDLLTKVVVQAGHVACPEMAEVVVVVRNQVAFHQEAK